jgi:periplasmic protein TonB
MAAFVLNWFEDEDPRDLRRWAIAAAIVVSVHLGAIAAYLYVHEPNEIGDDVTPVSVELSPSEDTVDQTEVAPVPEVQQPQIQQPPPQDTPTIMAPPPPPPKPVEEQKPPTPAQAARVKGGAPHISSSWETSLVKHLEQFKRYPSGAQAQGAEGVVMLSFSVDRDGHVLAHQIVQSSGHPELDAEVMAMIERAQPLPPFPPDMTDAKLDLTVPIRFSLK